MVEQASHRRSHEPDNDIYDRDIHEQNAYEQNTYGQNIYDRDIYDQNTYDRDIYGKNVTDQRVPPYRFGQSGQTNSGPDRSVPLFLSDGDGEPDPAEYMTPARIRPRASLSSRILAGALATAAAGILIALFSSSDITRDIIVSAKASIDAVLPTPSAAAQPNNTRLTASDIQIKDTARLQAPANQTPGARSVTTVAAVAPTRNEITSAYQSAVQVRAPAAVTATATAAPPARKLDADELAALLNRARSLLNAGDIPPARLLLERAADAQEAGAALLLARTYDPDVLGTQDIRNIVADPATARVWYQKAAQLGSTDAQRRLSQLQK